MSGSRILMKAGVLSTPPSGYWSIAIDAAGNMYRVDDAGNAYPLSGVSIHGGLSGRSDPDSHPIEAITNLLATLDSLSQGIDTVKMHTFAASSLTVQSFASAPMIDLSWDNVVLHGSSKFSFDPVNPSQVVVNHDGKVLLFVKANFESNITSRVLVRVRARLNGVDVASTVNYAFSYHRDYVDVSSNIIPGVIIPTTAGQVLTIVADMANNDDVDQIGDTGAVWTRPTECSLTIQTVAED
jgi:hypothetical protein